jgi:hypothetical protein
MRVYMVRFPDRIGSGEIKTGSGETLKKTLTFLGACRHVHAAAASPERDYDVLPIRKS